MTVTGCALMALVAIFQGSVLGTKGSSPSGRTQRETVDLIELNHFMDPGGREVFRQVIFYDWNAEQNRFHVRSWRLVKDPSTLPQQQWRPAGFFVSWIEDDRLRVVWAPKMRHTYSSRDPERVNRQYLAEEDRQPLFQKTMTIPVTSEVSEIVETRRTR